MLKNILIISVIILLIATVSNIIPVQAQSLDSKSTKSLENNKFENAQDNSDDYHRSVNERFVVNTLKKLYDAQAAYTLNYGGGEFARLDELRNANLIDDVLATEAKYGYIFSINLRRTRAGVPPGFEISAKPRHYGRTGKRSFYINAQCLIRGGDKSGFEAEFDDPILEECSPYLAYQFEYDISYSIKQLMLAQQEYFVGDGNGTFGTLNELIDAGLIDQILSNAWFMWIDMEVIPPTKQTNAGYKIWGTPLIYRETGIRSYYADESGILRAADIEGEFADENTPPLIFENEDIIKFAMRSLWIAQLRYICFSETGCGGFATEFNQLLKTRLIDFEIANSEFAGYQFEMNVVNPKDEPWLNNFEIIATPINYGKGSSRSFYISKNNVLRGADISGKPANENDPIVEY